MVAGQVPFEDEDISMLYSKIMFGDYEMPEDLSSGLEDLLMSMLETNPVRRPDFEGLEKFSWVKEGKNAKE